MKYLPFLLFLSLMGCGAEKKEDTIDREIRLKEVRKGHDIVKLTINLEKTIDDTSEIHYEAHIRQNLTDTIIKDSLFLIKGAGGVLLPFSTKNP